MRPGVLPSSIWPSAHTMFWLRARTWESVVHSGVVLTVGASAVLDFRLKVASARENVFVNAQVSRVEAQTGAVSSLVNSEQLHDLPLNGRNFEQLISLAPGVSLVPSSLGQTTTGVANNPVYGNQDNYSVSGSRPVGTAILLDNTDISDFFNHGTGSGVTGTALGVDAIAEFQILTNTYGAQFGGTGAVVNIASRSGTNAFHGSAYEFLRNDALNSRVSTSIRTESRRQRHRIAETNSAGPLAVRSGRTNYSSS